MPSEDERTDISLDEIRGLQLENKKLARELRVTKSIMDKIMRSGEAKDVFGTTLTAVGAQQKAYTDMLLESCPNIIFLLDDDGNFVLCTNVLLKLCGIHNFDFINSKPYAEVFAPYLDAETQARFLIAVADARAQGMAAMTSWIDFSRTGTPRCYSIELMTIGSDKGGNANITAGVLAVFTDMTDIMREKQRSESANNAKSDFLATMSHEIRTPMNAILGMSEMLGRSELSDAQAKYVSDIRKSSQSLLAIINDILDFSKIEAGRLDIVRSDYNLQQLLDNLRSIFSLMILGKNLDFDFNVDANVPQWVRGDENRLRQILTNLLSNAMKYTNEGLVSVHVYLVDEGKLRFDICDTGIGIRKEDQSRLFRPFEQLDTRRNKNVIGTGLGLAISHRLTNLMNGRLTLQSEYGKGSVFSVTLPYESSLTAHYVLEEENHNEFNAPNARVLVVDDIEINLAVAEAMLGAFAIEPVSVYSGPEAIRAAAKHEFDIIFMDHMMPEMDGVEATLQLRALGGWCTTVPIIALTANAINGMEEMFLKNQFDDYLPKPLDLATLNICLRKWLPQNLICITEE